MIYNNKEYNKGYMLVEIILASAIAFGVAFFILSLIMKLKTKNDDLLVDTIINTDRAIITNKLMSEAKLEGRLPNEETNEPVFDCNELEIDGRTIEYRGKIIDTIDDIAEIDSDAINIINNYEKIMSNLEETEERKVKAKSYCSNEMGVIHINIPIKVNQMPDKNYDINIDYKYEIGDMIPPICELSYNDGKITATSHDDGDNASGISYFGWDKDHQGETSVEKEVEQEGHYTYYVTDKNNNLGECSIDLEKKQKYYQSNCQKQKQHVTKTDCFSCPTKDGNGSWDNGGGYRWWHRNCSKPSGQSVYQCSECCNEWYEYVCTSWGEQILTDSCIASKNSVQCTPIEILEVVK